MDVEIPRFQTIANSFFPPSDLSFNLSSLIVSSLGFPFHSAMFRDVIDVPIALYIRALNDLQTATAPRIR
ncbi:MAG: hypothetical protein ABJO75_19595 [Sedimentitalea sp.]|uniref:hypothetical protein n=1 Tax=Sedimentitalea sp. TaxID=2048915 RepID=UPI003265DD12